MVKKVPDILISAPKYHSHSIFLENVVAINLLNYPQNNEV